MIEFKRHILSNGIRLLHHFDAATRMVALNILYDVGARDETPSHTGLAHLMEHLMFSGSEHVESFNETLERAGGISNAWTSWDVTNYYETLPAENIETAMWLESDRMRGLNVSQTNVDVQRSVVIEEFKQRYLNAPYGDLSHLLFPLAYKVHPYRVPVIGERVEHIQGLSLELVRSFYETHYSPDNAVLCLSGNISFERAVELTEKWFGDINGTSHYRRNLPQEPAQNEYRRLEVERDVPQTLIARAYKMCGRNDALFVASDLLSDVLANGKSSRFYQNLVLKSDVFTQADASVLGTLDPGVFLVTALLAEGANVADAEKMIDEQLEELILKGVSQYELEKCVNKFMSNHLFENVGYAKKATNLCLSELRGDAYLVNDELAEYASATCSDVVNVARQILRRENCSTLIYKARN
ncbi:MAG: insulinase family protein [Muribaculaceae bacterium]|nr:insulinase family protein [Muribaculaceae bacterium]